MSQPPLNRAGGFVAACENEADCHPVSCSECLNQIPAEAPYTADLDDYVHHFCGLECWDIWQKKRQQP